MKDAWPVARKEWMELWGQDGMQGRQGMLLFLGAFGIVLPLMNGPAWVTSPVMALSWAWVPMFLVMTIIADAFAGERERHTLETLLATRLSEAAILFGKMGAAVGYAVILSAASLIVGVIAVNIANRGDGLILYEARTLLVMGAVGVLGAVFIGALGSVISLRAATVRQAQQTLAATIFVVFMLPIWIVKLLRDWNVNVADKAAAGAQAGVIVLGLLILSDVALVALALARFQRNRIIAG
jgi:ABC-2 type transport system permease protein